MFQFRILLMLDQFFFLKYLLYLYPILKLKLLKIKNNAIIYKIYYLLMFLCDELSLKNLYL